MSVSEKLIKKAIKIEMSIAGFYGNVKRLMVNCEISRYMLNLKHLVDYYSNF